jgi:nucleoid DNA-binding protein
MAKKTAPIAAAMTKSQLMASIAEATKLPKRQVAGVVESLSEHIIRHLKPKGVGKFTLPGLAKFTTVSKPARKARKGVNPFTGEEIMIKAKPASRGVRIRPLKALKDQV